MCGIVAYTGRRDAQPILLEGIARLEYRGYDSSGLAIVNGKLSVKKAVGRIAALQQVLDEQPLTGNTGICHTRWATHGNVTESNAHPHLGGEGDGAVAIVHNGVIENYDLLKRHLQSQGYIFRSQTDTEVIAHLIASFLEDDLIEAVRQALVMLKGTYGLAVVSPRFPELIVGARLGSPLVLGLGENENFLASDPSALGGHAKRVVYLTDNQMCVLTPDRWEILDAERGSMEAEIHALDWRTGRFATRGTTSTTCSRRSTSSPK